LQLSAVSSVRDTVEIQEGHKRSGLRGARRGLPPDSPHRQALSEFIRAAGLVRRIGVNLNQAVARLNATGQRSGDLLPYTAENVRRAQLLDQAAEELRRRLRQ
jgi:hypothetical protein